MQSLCTGLLKAIEGLLFLLFMGLVVSVLIAPFLFGSWAIMSFIGEGIGWWVAIAVFIPFATAYLACAQAGMDWLDSRLPEAEECS